MVIPDYHPNLDNPRLVPLQRRRTAWYLHAVPWLYADIPLSRLAIEITSLGCHFEIAWMIDTIDYWSSTGMLTFTSGEMQWIYCIWAMSFRFQGSKQASSWIHQGIPLLNGEESWLTCRLKLLVAKSKTGANYSWYRVSNRDSNQPFWGHITSYKNTISQMKAHF